MIEEIEILALLTIVTGTPMLATLVGRVLASRHAGHDAQQTVTNFKDRVNAWWAMLAVAALAFVFGVSGVIVLFALLSFLALREFITLTRLRRADHWSVLAAFFIAIPVQYYLVWIEWYGLFSILIPVFAFVLLPISSALRGDSVAFLERVAQVQWGVMIAVFCLSHVPALATLHIPGYEGRALLLVVYLLIIVQMSDVFQYFAGKLFGRHRIAPSLSPMKTVEGTVIGVAGATVLGSALWWITPFTWWQAGLLALMTTTMGFCGGLVLSAIKRDRGVKDWGWSIPGPGGVLDRLDSVVFAAPVFFHLARYGWAG